LALIIRFIARYPIAVIAAPDYNFSNRVPKTVSNRHVTTATYVSGDRNTDMQDG